MPSRRLDDRIRELCAKIGRSPDSEAEPVLTELQILLHEKIQRLRTQAAAFLGIDPPLVKERRSPREKDS